MTKHELSLIKHTDRTSIRQQVRLRRKELTVTFQNKAAKALLDRLKNDIAVKEAEHIALYFANNSELNLQPFIQWCWQQKKSIYLPVVHPFSKGHLLFLSYDNNSSMVVNQYNIEEPKLDVRHIKPIQQLDMILTPLVAFDSTGARIGMGGGYYDRTLANWHKQALQNYTIKLTVIGIAHDCQQIPKVPSEAWDIPLPKIITPTRTIKCAFHS